MVVLSLKCPLFLALRSPEAAQDIYDAGIRFLEFFKALNVIHVRLVTELVRFPLVGKVKNDGACDQNITRLGSCIFSGASEVLGHLCWEAKRHRAFASDAFQNFANCLRTQPTLYTHISG